MSKILLLGKLLLIVLLFSVIIYVVKYAQDLRELFSDRTYKRVAGARTSLETEIKKDVASYLNSGKEQFLNLKIKDIYEPLSRMGKIRNDFSGTKNEIEDKMKEILKRKN